MPMLTDAEQRFADSAEGRRHVADAARRHHLREAHKGTGARPWTDALAAEAVRDGAVTAARNSLARAVHDAAAPADFSAAVAARDTAAAIRRDRISNGWRR